MMAGFWDMQLKDLANLAILIATIMAIYYGPIKAVKISRDNARVDGKRDRQLSVFHSLIKTRKFQLSPEHVTALNLVQLEFYGSDSVLKSYKNYMGLLNGAWPSIDDPNFQRFHDGVADALYELLHEIGLVLGFVMDRGELKRLAYGPAGWETEEAQQKAARGLVIERYKKARCRLSTLPRSNNMKGSFPRHLVR